MVSEMTIAACCCQIWSFIQYLLWTWQWQPPNIHVVGVGFQFSTYSSVCRCDSSWDATKDTQTGGSQINDEPGRYMKEICSSPVHLVCKLFNITRGQNFSWYLWLQSGEEVLDPLLSVNTVTLICILPLLSLVMWCFSVKRQRTFCV